MVRTWGPTPLNPAAREGPDRASYGNRLVSQQVLMRVKPCEHVQRILLVASDAHHESALLAALLDEPSVQACAQVHGLVQVDFAEYGKI